MRSELTATVDRGYNVVNFDLDSRSPVVQPDSIGAVDQQSSNP